MKLVIFAGGIGTRLWPLSRENSPKQFDKIFNGKSTLQLAMERVGPAFGIENIFIQTVGKYKAFIRKQIPKLPAKNILIEPARRNIAPAVCYSVLELQKRGYKGEIAILWADHLMERKKEFVRALRAGEKLIRQNPARLIFLAERPRFANNNLGWVRIGKKAGEINGRDYFYFQGWKYKPKPRLCQQLYKSGRAFWNPGYFITSIEFLDKQYRKLAPAIYQRVKLGQYRQAAAVHFDQVIAEKIDRNKAVVIKTDMGWSDPGTLYALKEALQKSQTDNVTQGKVVSLDTRDCLLYNLEKNKLVATVGLEGMVVVNTPDALVVVPKDEVVKITDLLKKMKEKGMGKYL